MSMTCTVSSRKKAEEEVEESPEPHKTYADIVRVGAGVFGVEAPVGLRNLANTCYLNAVLQCLFHTPSLTHALNTHHKTLSQRRSLLEDGEKWLVEMVRFFKEVQEAKGTVESISAVNIAALMRRNKRFAYGQQADAHEALVFIMSQLLAGCSSAGGSSPSSSYAEREKRERGSLVGHVFGMDLGQSVCCQTCKNDSKAARVEYCWCLASTLGMTEKQQEALLRDSLRDPLQERRPPYSQGGSHSLNGGYANYGSYAGYGGFGGYSGYGASNTFGGGSGGYSSSAGGASVPDTSLEDMLRAYTRAERIDSYKCDQCSRQTGCERTAYITRRPNVLVVYIDRRQDSGLYGKIKRAVRFGQRLDLGDFVRDGAAPATCGYSLYAVVVHQDVNRSTNFGHYVAYVKDRFGQWHLLNDARVERAPWSTVASQEASLLFYAADHTLPPEELLAEGGTAKDKIRTTALGHSAIDASDTTCPASETGSEANSSSVISVADAAATPEGGTAVLEHIWQCSRRAAAEAAGGGDPSGAPNRDVVASVAESRRSAAIADGGGGLFDFDLLDEAEEQQLMGSLAAPL